ncbi:hypothetical protein GPECTOR_24g209 [Gonium pectorale]|uniref:Uncharacterized protein n=1 Tax=Gonium pectorale TaxID=33097 RepID=A0A150GHU6_GONPE|nr:hypothetical protein GPECTOR_24g209 [Gonium pectorale]|eukprot:KXZ48920.1 hypothetical protein GPECTOR_24g209 [Gonium pectorale]
MANKAVLRLDNIAILPSEGKPTAAATTAGVVIDANTYSTVQRIKGKVASIGLKDPSQIEVRALNQSRGSAVAAGGTRIQTTSISIETRTLTDACVIASKFRDGKLQVPIPNPSGQAGYMEGAPAVSLLLKPTDTPTTSFSPPRLAVITVIEGTPMEKPEDSFKRAAHHMAEQGALGEKANAEAAVYAVHDTLHSLAACLLSAKCTPANNNSLIPEESKRPGIRKRLAVLQYTDPSYDDIARKGRVWFVGARGYIIRIEFVTTPDKYPNPDDHPSYHNPAAFALTLGVEPLRRMPATISTSELGEIVLSVKERVAKVQPAQRMLGAKYQKLQATAAPPPSEPSRPLHVRGSAGSYMELSAITAEEAHQYAGLITASGDVYWAHEREPKQGEVCLAGITAFAVCFADRGSLGAGLLACMGAEGFDSIFVAKGRPYLPGLAPRRSHVLEPGINWKSVSKGNELLNLMSPALIGAALCAGNERPLAFCTAPTLGDIKKVRACLQEGAYHAVVSKPYEPPELITGQTLASPEPAAFTLDELLQDDDEGDGGLPEAVMPRKLDADLSAAEGNGQDLRPQGPSAKPPATAPSHTSAPIPD